MSQRASVDSYEYIPSSPILVTPMMEALRSSETSVLTRATWYNIPEDAILYFILCPSHREKNDLFQIQYSSHDSLRAQGLGPGPSPFPHQDHFVNVQLFYLKLP
jgi:hypothetical protein